MQIPFNDDLALFPVKADTQGRAFFMLHHLCEGRVIFPNKVFCLTKKKWSPNKDQDIKEALNQVSDKKIYLFFYEAKNFFNLDKKNLVEDRPLWIELVFSHKKLMSLDNNVSHDIEINFVHPLKKEYKENFFKGRQRLLKGDCYQFNLTFPFKASIPVDKIQAITENVLLSASAPLAHIIHLPSFQKTFISNTPEVLFQAKIEKDRARLMSFPIKGTKKVGSEKIKKVWKELSASIKDQAELYMITDLLRNDLKKIAQTQVQVYKKKEMLLAPGVVHQYSQIGTSVPPDVSLFQVMKSLFPGGSITGAPKVRVMEILNELENRPRGFYCGSTLFQNKCLLTASINIRSGEYDHGEETLHWGAGGGITLLSDWETEYEEMILKSESFISTLSGQSSRFFQSTE